MTSSADTHPSASRLERPRDGRMIAGVCAGIGRNLNIDPTLVRIAFVVGVALGGAGFVAYAAAWLLMPVEGNEKAPLQSMRRGHVAVVIGALLLIIGVSAALHSFDSGVAGNAFWPIVVAGTGIYLIMRARDRRDDRPGAPGAGAAETATVAGGRRSSRSATVAVAGIMLLGAGTVAALAAFGVDLGWEAAAGIIVIIAGAALVGGAFFGASPWLALPALVVAAGVGALGAADVHLRGPVGERTYSPATAAEIPASYRMAMGDMQVDLRHVALLPGTTKVKAELGIGGMRIYVPAGVTLRLSGHAGGGRLEFPGATGDGTDVDRRATLVAPGRRVLDVDAKVGVGEVRILRDRAPR